MTLDTTRYERALEQVTGAMASFDHGVFRRSLAMIPADRPPLFPCRRPAATILRRDSSGVWHEIRRFERFESEAELRFAPGKPPRTVFIPNRAVTDTRFPA